MITKRNVAAVSLAFIVLALSACSSSAKQAAPTSTTPGPTLGTALPTTVPKPQAVNAIGCTTTFPRQFLTKLNAGVTGLGTKLVPITATNVRVCRYNGHAVLVGSGKFPAASVAAFLAETNQLAKLTPKSCSVGDFTRFFFLTFSDGTKSVNLGEHDGCGAGVGNGIFVAKENAKWVNEVIANS